MASAHVEEVWYETDSAHEHGRRRVTTGRCRACRAAWPCLAEVGRRVAAAAVARERA